MAKRKNLQKIKIKFQEETKMRNLHKLLGLALATALCATTVMATASCGNNSEGKPGIVVKGTGDTIAVIAKGETHAFWQAVKAGAEAAGKEFGYKVTFSGPPTENVSDAPIQRTKLQAALSSDSTRAVVLATIGNGFQDELVDAHDKGIPIVEFDSGLYDNGADVTPGKDPRIGKVATSNTKAAALVAENFFKYIKENGKLVKGTEFKIGIIQHDTTQTGIDRADGFKNKMTELAAAEGYNVTWAAKQVSEVGKYSQAVTALKDSCQAIFMSNEGIVNEVQPTVFGDSSYKNILFCGFDCGSKQYDWIKDAGNKYALLVGSVAQDSYSIGYEAVKMAAQIPAGDTKGETKIVDIAGQWYTSANIDELKDKNIFYLG